MSLRRGRLLVVCIGLLTALGIEPSVAQAPPDGSGPVATPVPDTTTTTLPTGGLAPSNVDLGHRPIGTSSIVLFPAFLTEPFTPGEYLDLDSALAARGIPGPSGEARPLPLHPAPITGSAPLLTTTGASLQSQFVPPAILGVLIAWATLTLFEFRRMSRPEDPLNPGDGEPSAAN